MGNFCEKCGAKLVPESKFCESCGTIVEDVPPMTSNPMPQNRKMGKVLFACIAVLIFLVTIVILYYFLVVTEKSYKLDSDFSLDDTESYMEEENSQYEEQYKVSIMPKKYAFGWEEISWTDVGILEKESVMIQTQGYALALQEDGVRIPSQQRSYSFYGFADTNNDEIADCFLMTIPVVYDGEDQIFEEALSDFYIGMAPKILEHSLVKMTKLSESEIKKSMDELWNDEKREWVHEDEGIEFQSGDYTIGIMYDEGIEEMVFYIFYGSENKENGDNLSIEEKLLGFSEEDEKKQTTESEESNIPTTTPIATPEVTVSATPTPLPTEIPVELETYTNNDILQEVNHFTGFQVEGSQNRLQDLERFEQYIAGNYQNYGKNCYTFINNNIYSMLYDGSDSLYAYLENNMKDALATAIMASYLNDFGKEKVRWAVNDAIGNGLLSNNYVMTYLTDSDQAVFVANMDSIGTYLIEVIKAYYIDGKEFGQGNLESEQLAIDYYDAVRHAELAGTSIL